jgi:hypothetical protein
MAAGQQPVITQRSHHKANTDFSTNTRAHSLKATKSHIQSEGKKGQPMTLYPTKLSLTHYKINMKKFFPNNKWFWLNRKMLDNSSPHGGISK